VGSGVPGWGERVLRLIGVAVVLVVARPAFAAMTPDQTARVLAGLDEAPAALSVHAAPMIRPYARAVTDRWDLYQRRIGEPMRKWARAELAAAPGETVFYPFSGPDFPTVEQLYPQAGRFVLVAIQRADPPPPIGRYSPQELSTFLALFRTGWERFAQLGFFLTKDLDADQQLPGIRVAVTPLLMAFAARAGYEVVAVEPVRISADGADLEVHAGDRANRSTWESVRLTLAREGRTVILDYVRVDLSDGFLARQRATRSWIESMARNRTVLKAASHLPQQPYFSIVRDAILAGAPSLWQDETGIDYATLAARFEVTRYGRFSRPHHLFPGAQRSLAAAHERQPQARPLPFKVGYEKESGSSVQVAMRDALPRGEPAVAAMPAVAQVPATRAAPRPAALDADIRTLEARIEERTRRFEARPRRVFVGGRTEEVPYAGYVRDVREKLALAVPSGRPAKSSVVSVAIAADGSLSALDLDRSSGSAAYDRRARSAVQDAAPFPPLSEEIRGRADLLVITFQFPDP